MIQTVSVVKKVLIKLMFSILIAFHILYRLSSNKKRRSALELPKSLDCGRKPAGLSSGRFSKRCKAAGSIGVYTTSVLPDLQGTHP
jgi:hypothetical protein